MKRMRNMKNAGPRNLDQLVIDPLEKAKEAKISEDIKSSSDSDTASCPEPSLLSLPNAERMAQFIIHSSEDEDEENEDDGGTDEDDEAFDRGANDIGSQPILKSTADGTDDPADTIYRSGRYIVSDLFY